MLSIYKFPLEQSTVEIISGIMHNTIHSKTIILLGLEVYKFFLRDLLVIILKKSINQYFYIFFL
jgi:hypothetical protein